MPPNTQLPHNIMLLDRLPSELTLSADDSDVTKTVVESPNQRITQENAMRPLHCVAQQYAWGRLGSSSRVARMRKAQSVQQEDCNNDDDFSIDETQPYAELWLGTHPCGMSQVTITRTLDSENAKPTHSDGAMYPTSIANDDTWEETPSTSSDDDDILSKTTTAAATTTTYAKCSLLDYVQSNPKLHCSAGPQHCADLPFLLKVLSVRKVLSIQAHPDHELARRLHAQRPDLYKDANHKPEMAIALSDSVRAMCGFRPMHEIGTHLRDFPEFRTLLGEDVARPIEQAAAAAAGTNRTNAQSDAHKSILRNMFQVYLTVPKDVVRFLVERMVTRLQTTTTTHEHEHDDDDDGGGGGSPMTTTPVSRSSSDDDDDDVSNLMLQLHEQFPGDCGVFAPLLLNILPLTTGQALFIPANEPHAYISGDILECMACSDNVVRAGLTPKWKDVATLVDMLTYNCGMPVVSNGCVVDDCCVRYSPPVRDFCMEVVTVEPAQCCELAAVASPGIVLVLEGSGRLVQQPSLSSSVFDRTVSFGSAAFLSAHTTCDIHAGPYGVQLVRACSNVYLQ